MSGIRAKLFVLIAITLLFTSCQQTMVMWVVPGSTADDLVFGWSTARDGDDKIQPISITVFPCDTIHPQPDGGYYPYPGRAIWDGSSPYDELPAPTNRLTYGHGFPQSPVGPLEVPGCYVVIAYARDSQGYTEVATLGFKIAIDGTATDMPRDEYRKLFR